MEMPIIADRMKYNPKVNKPLVSNTQPPSPKACVSETKYEYNGESRSMGAKVAYDYNFSNSDDKPTQNSQSS
jgi:hypothetical protein